jgi:hypothetical protein
LEHDTDSVTFASIAHSVHQMDSLRL